VTPPFPLTRKQAFARFATSGANHTGVRFGKATAAVGIIGAFGMNGRAVAAAPLMAKAREEAGNLPNVKKMLAEYGAAGRIQKGKPVPSFSRSVARLWYIPKHRSKARCT
jgi:hypothetical protein